MEKVAWKVGGMTCTNCALSIDKYLQKEGAQDVRVNFVGGEVSFSVNDDTSTEKIAKGISALGYRVDDGKQKQNKKGGFLTNHLQRFLFCLPFTAVLMLHMLPWHIHFLSNPWIQMAICLPVFLVGMRYFGVSAVKSLRSGIPNMNVLIALGAVAAFVYSLIGSLQQLGMDYIFYETTATIITLVFLGEWIEQKTVSTTQRQLNSLAAKQHVMANMIAFDDNHQELVFPVDSKDLHTGDLVLIRNGEQVPADCRILWGDCSVSEALLTGESEPLPRTKKDQLIGGSLLVAGTVKAQVTAVGKDTVLSNIVSLAQQAQAAKPPIQQLADKISAIFVPVVIGLSICTFFINYYWVAVPFTDALMRSIAVLVISCPCAMGLATPAAIAVGLGRATRKGILFRDAKSLELFRNIKTVVFDKTGTLTMGEMSVGPFNAVGIDADTFKRIVFSLEKYSNHPIARSILRDWKQERPLPWKKIEEKRGVGIEATDEHGDVYQLFSYKALPAGTTREEGHTAYLLRNSALLGWFDVEDRMRSEVPGLISHLQERGIRTVLLSGDTLARASQLAKQAGITEVFAEKSPAEKLDIISTLNNESPVAMVGDGINDAPALARATIGISMSDASQLAVQTAQVVLMKNGLTELPQALGLGKHTYLTIRENLFWAFIYNVVAIPIAAAGYLQPGFAALAMGLSDVVLAINSIRLNYKKVT